MSRYVSVYVGDVDVPVGDVLEGISTEQLLSELKRRDIAATLVEELEDVGIYRVLAMLHRGETGDAITELERLHMPRFKSLSDSVKAYAAVPKRRDTGTPPELN